MNDFNQRYDFDRDRHKNSGSHRLLTILILLAVLAVTGAIIYFTIPRETSEPGRKPDTGKTAPVETGIKAPKDDPQTAAKPAAPDGGTVNTTEPGKDTGSPPAGPEENPTATPGTSTEKSDPAAKTGVNDPLERAIEVTVQPGETLETIARRHHTTPRSIRHFNGLKSDRIRNGQKLKVIPGPWRMTVTRKRNELTLEHAPDGKWRLFRSFPADATGLKGKFVIPSIHYHPTWINAHGGQFKYGDPENPCGDYLLKLAPPKTPRNPLAGFGIHGVDDKTSNLKNCGRTCIHVGARDIELLYYLVCPGTEVTVISGEDAGNLEI